ncbi:MAG: transcriptional repressor LexA [Rhodospirillales bacterium]|nr:transcriptional repressor LexA [Rhodospirillales bacterium]
MLTRKQHELLRFLHDYLEQQGISPSFDEMKEALGLKSKSGIHRLILALEERRFIRRLPNRARAIEVLRLPGDLAQEPEPHGLSPKVIQGGFGEVAAPSPPEDGSRPEASQIEAEVAQLPLLGRIAAGTPIEALQDHSVSVEVPMSFLGSGEHYALEVEGDSMIEAGIHDGDTIIVNRSDTADNGSIVVALIDDREATLKRLRRKGGAIALEPANKTYETRIFPPKRVKIQGRLIGLMRRY